MLDLILTNPQAFITWTVAIVIAITIHEFAHAWTADKLGDPTPRSMGRVSLNPLDHLDPLGTLLIIIASFGWGKPVPFDPYNLDNPRRDTLLISLAGPASNLILALLLTLSSALLPKFYLIAWPIIYLNVALAIFNLVPIPPLDGSKILGSLLPPDKAIEWEQFGNQYGIYLLIFAILPFGGASLISRFIFPIIDFIVKQLFQITLFS